MRAESSFKWHIDPLDPACERAHLLISRHIDGELEPGDLLALRAHLSACAHCRHALEAQTEQSHELAEALRGLWPDLSQETLKKKHYTAHDVWLKCRRAVSKAGAGLMTLGGIILFAAAAQGSSDTKSQKLGGLKPPARLSQAPHWQAEH